jgi:hypothetical protein
MTRRERAAALDARPHRRGGVQTKGRLLSF